MGLAKVFFPCQPPEKGFWPLAKDFALLAKQLQIVFTKTCRKEKKLAKVLHIVTC